jgi:rfaE bifunctional protein nucleotidyltransferase chain/domain
MEALRKIVHYEELAKWRSCLGGAHFPLVATNGCFDLLHAGHVSLLERARRLGNFLIVGVSSDQTVRTLKGTARPVVCESDRLILLAALEVVDAVCLFPEVNAVSFLEKVRPNLYVKGGDYSMDSINQLERRLLQEMSVKIKILPAYQERSTSRLVERARNLSAS